MNAQAGQILEQIKTMWDTIPQQYMIVIYLAGTVFALLNCFMGYRLRKVWGCILGILAGGGGGAAAAYYFLHDKVMALVCGAAGALILGLLAWLLYKFGVFFMCTGLVYAMILSFFEDASMKQHIIGLVIGVFAGTLALGYEKQMLIGITSICGGIGGIHLLMAMTGTKAGAGELLLGIILAAIGMAVQAAPFLKGKDWEAEIFHLSSGRKKRGLPGGRRKKVVKKKVVTKTKREKGYGSRGALGQKKNRRYEDYDNDEYDEYEDEYENKYEEAYESDSKYDSRYSREELDKTQEYQVGQRQFETDRQRQQMPYMGSGIGIDLDDLNRELSQEIQKIYKDDSQ